MKVFLATHNLTPVSVEEVKKSFEYSHVSKCLYSVGTFSQACGTAGETLQICDCLLCVVVLTANISLSWQVCSCDGNRGHSVQHKAAFPLIRPLRAQFI